MRRKSRKILVGILGICILMGSISASLPVYAEGEATQDISQEIIIEESAEGAYNEIPETAGMENEDIESDGIGDPGTEESITNIQEQDGLGEQSEMMKNSWRYQKGELIRTPQLQARTASYPYAWQKVNGAYVNSIGNPIEGAVKKGIDVSYAQGEINWEKVKADGIEFAIIQCGFGNDHSSQDDKYWERNASECERLGIPYGVYLFSYATNTAMAKSEAEHVLRLIRGRNLSYPVYFDMEIKAVESKTAAEKGEIAKTFCDIVSAAGYKVGIYANLYWWDTYLTSPVFNNPSWSKWVAQYNTTCSYNGPYDIWQCSDTGRVAGINEDVDLNFLMNADLAPQDPDEDIAGTTLAVRRGNKYHIKYSLKNGEADLVVPYGYSTDEVLVGDWNGDGVDTLCVRRGNTYYFKNSLSSGEADIVVSYGKANDVVLVGDWDGDGVDTLCVRRGNAYHIKNNFEPGVADQVVLYGKAGDSVLVGDWDGDGKDTICARRGNTYYFKNSLSEGEADSVIKYGWASDSILVGDWNNDGVDTLCVRRGNAYHIKNSIQIGEADKVVLYGRKDDVTYAGKWK
ncbi:glycoside hydrolase family 25 protein [Faecalicatena contorta]|uniref:Lyzozyme M1 (1,4-beta-N-acetylmuramidase), GH25 family n=1 Tax=Faecalicatena contorta TaxID=39482 RepID=A0A315ZS30_9FIRM|nr:glycoside hydrolase family 25 protein [Faecalicatena contorta]PWJ48356.1 GH25 family lysozyme M1 (1,4-beta-N-acetylmuramidase) [Faecalicatena contorta]SUQ15379.1 Lyzozyme M1 (1,4-beta-N-acetylmuramidase), GH25 family [Faecalicatena contorta]